MANFDSRELFERWARSSVRVISETDDVVVVELFDSRTIVCPKSDISVRECIVRDGMWESWVSLFVCRNLTPDHLFIDVGANCGYYSVLASLVTDKVWSFEPNPEYIDLLSETASLNVQHMDMKVLPYALSSKSGKATLHIPGRLEGSASLRNVFGGDYDLREVGVDVATLDEFSPEGDAPILIKIDAEGLEEEIWKGSTKFRERFAPTFVMEYTPGSYSKEFVKTMEEYGKLSIVDFAGEERPVAREELESTTEWKTVVVRP